MIFRLTTSEDWYTEDQAKMLEALGFSFVRHENIRSSENLRINNYDVSIEINSLEELVDFQQKWGDIIFSNDEIEIYNGYRE